MCAEPNIVLPSQRKPITIHFPSGTLPSLITLDAKTQQMVTWEAERDPGAAGSGQQSGVGRGKGPDGTSSPLRDCPESTARASDLVAPPQHRWLVFRLIRFIGRVAGFGFVCVPVVSRFRRVGPLCSFCPRLRMLMTICSRDLTSSNSEVEIQY